MTSQCASRKTPIIHSSYNDTRSAVLVNREHSVVTTFLEMPSNKIEANQTEQLAVVVESWRHALSAPNKSARAYATNDWRLSQLQWRAPGNRVQTRSRLRVGSWNLGTHLEATACPRGMSRVAFAGPVRVSRRHLASLLNRGSPKAAGSERRNRGDSSLAVSFLCT